MRRVPGSGRSGSVGLDAATRGRGRPRSEAGSRLMPASKSESRFAACREMSLQHRPCRRQIFRSREKSKRRPSSRTGGFGRSLTCRDESVPLVAGPRRAVPRRMPSSASSGADTGGCALRDRHLSRIAHARASPACDIGEPRDQLVDRSSCSVPTASWLTAPRNLLRQVPTANLDTRSSQLFPVRY